MKPVKLSDLILALESDSEEEITMVDLQTGRVETVDRSVLSAIESGDEASLGDPPEWQVPELKIARAITEDPGGRFVHAPNKFDFHEYRQMERFIGTVEDRAAAEQLWRAIKGNGAFRYFKDTARRLDLLKQWHQYRDDAMKEYVRDWAEANHVQIVDDTKPIS